MPDLVTFACGYLHIDAYPCTRTHTHTNTRYTHIQTAKLYWYKTINNYVLKKGSTHTKHKCLTFWRIYSVCFPCCTVHRPTVVFNT